MDMVWLDFYADVAIAAKDVQAIESLAGVSLLAVSRKNSSSQATSRPLHKRQRWVPGKV